MVGIDCADMVLVNGKVVSVDSEDTIAEAVAIREGKILHVGSSQEVMRFTGKETRTVDLKGRTVLPGFIDAHTHIEGIANHLFFLDVHIPPLKDVGEVLEKVKVSRATLYNWLKQGKVPDVKRDRNNFRIFTDVDIKKILDYKNLIIEPR